MKIAICFFGVVPRSIKWTYLSILERIIKPIKNKYKVDIYVFNMNVSDTKVDGVKLDQENCKILECDFFEERRQANVNEDINKFCSIYPCEMSYGSLSDKGTINSIRTMYSEYRVGLFLEKHIDIYEVAVVISPDFFFRNEINIDDIEKCKVDSKVIYTTNNHDGIDGYTDGLYIGKSKDLIPVLKRYEIKEKYISPKNNYERILKESFTDNGIERRITNLEFCKIRANKKIWGKKKIEKNDPLRPF
jgi:hypothetical protein